LLLEKMRAGGGVGFAGLLHAPTNQALEVFIGRHRLGPLVRPRATRPPAATPAASQRLEPDSIREYAPLCLAKGPCWGRADEVGRGSSARALLCIFPAAQSRGPLP